MSAERVHLIVMLIAGESARDTLQVLASIGRLVREQELVDGFVHAPDLDTLYERLLGGFGGMRPIQAQQNRVNRLMFRQAEHVARGAGCSATMIFGDTFIGGIEPAVLRPKGKTILVTRNPIEPGEDGSTYTDTIQVRSFSSQRMAQLRSALLVALTRGLHLLQRQDLLHRRDHRQQPVRHHRRGGDREGVPDAAFRARHRPPAGGREARGP